jgi:acyl carrier protein
MHHQEQVRRVLHDYLMANYLPSGTAPLADDDDLFDTGVLDSAGLLALLAWIEQEFELDIPDDHLLPDNFTSITRTSSYICDRRAALEASQCANV